MGLGFIIHCMSCGDEAHYLQGIGFRHNTFLQEVKEEVAAGKLGKEAQTFIVKFPDCKMDATKEVYFCDQCRNIKQGVDLKMSCGDKYFKKQYRCGKCRKVAMKPIMRNYDKLLTEPNQIPCKKCGDSEHTTVNFLMWD